MKTTNNNMSDIGRGLRRGIRVNPLDTSRHLIYADWLDEMGRYSEADARRKYAERYVKAARTAKIDTKLSLMYSSAIRRERNRVRRADYNGEAISSHQRASISHDKAAVLAYKMKDIGLALKHGIMGYRHEGALRAHEEGEPLSREERKALVAKPDHYEHEGAADYHNEGDNPQLAALHQKAANILRNRRN